MNNNSNTTSETHPPPSNGRASEGDTQEGAARMPHDQMRAQVKGELVQALERIEATYVEHADDPQEAKEILTQTIRAIASTRTAGASWPDPRSSVRCL